MHELTKRTDMLSKILPVVCRIDASMRNAIFDSKSIFDLSKKSTIREDIDQFTKEILGINLWKDTKQATL
jgi:chromosome partitioning protein